MSDHDEKLGRLERLARANNVLDQRTSAGAVQDLGKLGTHSRPFSCSQNYDGCLACGHVAAIVAFPRSFGNRNGIVFDASWF
jgi:hypothetical protein